jgi:lysozyme
MNLDALITALQLDEGRKVKNWRHQLYQCPAGKWTIGYGRNLEANGISETEALDMLTADAIKAFQDAAELVPNWLLVDDVRQGVVSNMAFNMGKKKLSTFVKFLAAVNDKRWGDASAEMKSSAWYHQVGKRSERLANEMLTGVA